MFWNILELNALINVATFVVAWVEHNATLGQMCLPYGQKGVPLLLHGGYWADVVIVGFALAEMITRYGSQWSVTAIAICAIVSIFMCAVAYGFYTEASLGVPNWTARDGKMTKAGWIHVAYSIPVLAVYLLFFFCTRRVDSLANAGLLCALVYLHIAAGFVLPAMYIGDLWTNKGVRNIFLGVTALWIGGCCWLAWVYIHQ